MYIFHESLVDDGLVYDDSNELLSGLKSNSLNITNFVLNCVGYWYKSSKVHEDV